MVRKEVKKQEQYLGKLDAIEQGSSAMKSELQRINTVLNEQLLSINEIKEASTELDQLSLILDESNNITEQLASLNNNITNRLKDATQSIDEAVEKHKDVQNQISKKMVELGVRNGEIVHLLNNSYKVLKEIIEST